MSVPAVVLVEGVSDEAAVLAAATLVGVDLVECQVQVVAMGGATNVTSYVQRYRDHDVALFGLCDAGERRLFEAVLDAEDVFVCDADLEEELIRATGVDAMLAFIDGEGDLRRFLTMQKQPAQRGRTIEEHLHRHCGVRAGRKARYAEGLVARLAPSEVPAPLAALIDAIR